MGGREKSQPRRVTPDRQQSAPDPMSPPTSFNKAKALEEAGRLVSQRKISQAIKHYLAISEHDPSDLSLLNTVGDLCIRDGNIAEALKQFQRLADAYAHEGFLLKAVAIHKKISKLVPNDVEPLLKLAGHYSSLSLGREAREHYMQALALCEKQALNHKALEILRKLVKQEPENLPFRIRLAEACAALGQNGPAAEIYAEIAEIAYRRGDLAAVDPPLQQAYQLDRMNTRANLLRARMAIDSHQTVRAKEILESSLALNPTPEAALLLVDVHALEGNLDAASQVVATTFRHGKDGSTILRHYVQACLSANDPDAALKPIREMAGVSLKHNMPEAIREPLRLISEKHPDHLPTLELIFHSSEQTAGAEDLLKAAESLSNAYIRASQNEKAAELYRQLLAREAGNSVWQAKLNAILQAGEEPPEGENVTVPKAEPAQPLDQPENPRVEEALENASIFARYGLIDKALEELDRALQSEPDDLKLWRQVVEIAKQERPQRAAQAAEVLAGLLRKREDLEGAGRFETLAQVLHGATLADAPFQADSPSGPGIASPQPESPVRPTPGRPDLEAQYGATWPPAQTISAPPEPQTVLSIPAPSMEFRRASVTQIDLTEEVEALASVEPDPAQEEITTAPDIFAEEQSEIDFYLEYGFFVEAEQAAGALAEKFPNHPGLPALMKRVEEATQSASARQEDRLEDQSEIGPAATEDDLAANAVVDQAADWDLAETQETPAEADFVQGPESATSTAPAGTGSEDQLFLTPEPGDWISGMPAESQQPNSVSAPVDEPDYSLQLEWISNSTITESEKDEISEAQPIPFEPTAVEELQAVPEIVAELPLQHLPEEFQFAPGVPPIIGEALPVDVSPPTPEVGPNEPGVEPEAEILSASELTFVPAPEPSGPELTPVEDRTAAVESMEAAPELVPVHDAPLAPGIPSTSSKPPSVEHPQSTFDMVPADSGTSNVEEMPSAAENVSDVMELQVIEEPPSTPELSSEAGQAEEPIAVSALPPEPETDRMSLGPAEDGVQAANPVPAEEPAPSSGTGPEGIVAAPEQEPPAILQPSPANEPWAETERSDDQPAIKLEPSPIPSDLQEAPSRASATIAPFPDFQTLIIDSSEEPSGFESEIEGAERSVPLPLQEPSRLERRSIPQRPATSFNEILQELSGDLAIAESPDTPEKHYNLGLAFREMELIDEAIGEFQKVVRGSVKGALPPRFLEACSLLASCFMQKGMPSIAVKWYQRALDVPGVEGDALLALNYDLADSMDRAGQKNSALEKFMEVYSENIDYRDVADRIRALQHSPA